MRNFIILAILGWGLMCAAQTSINKTIPVSSGQNIDFNFDYPNLIRVSSWNKNEISITGTVLINGGENDDAFQLTSIVSGDRVSVKGEIPKIKDLPQRITVRRNGETMVFKNKSEFEKYKNEKGGGFDMTSWGHDVEIVLDIKVPMNMTTVVKSVYGIVEVKELNHTMPFTAMSTYGGVDAALNTSAIGEIYASTDYGSIYSNLNTKFSGDGLKQKDFHTEVMAKPGRGAKYSFESKYGNVYLRKNQ